MAAPSANAVATVNIPRVRFVSAVLFVASSLIYALSRIISGIELSALYRTAMCASILTELFTLRMFLPKFAFTPDVLNAASTAPCLPHLMLSVFLWSNSSTFYFQMLSMVIVYVFLVLEYAPTDDLIANNPYWKTYGKQFTTLIVPRKASLLRIAAHLEILNLVLVLGSIIRFRGNLIHLLVFTQYLTSQYLSSPLTTQAVHFWDSLVSRLLNDPRCPPAIKFAEVKIREYLGKLVGFTRQFVPVENKPKK